MCECGNCGDHPNHEGLWGSAIPMGSTEGRPTRTIPLYAAVEAAMQDGVKAIQADPSFDWGAPWGS